MSIALPKLDLDNDSLFRIFATGGYFDTTSNYDTSGGSYTSLAAGRKYQLFSGEFGFEYKLDENFFIVGSIGVARAESNDGSFSRVKTEPTDGTLGLRYVLLREPIIIAPEVWASYPFNSFSNDTDEVLTGEGVTRAYGGSFFSYPISTISIYSNLGFLYQGDGRASLGLYSLGVEWKPLPFSTLIELNGSKVVLDDDFRHNRSVRDVVTNRVSGGSQKFGSVNPELMTAKVQANINLGSAWNIGASFEQSINGTATANGYQILGLLEYRWLNAETSEQADRSQVVSPPEESKGFEPESTDYDQTLFSNPKPKLKIKKSARKPERTKTKPIDVDKALEDVQKSLEK